MSNLTCLAVAFEVSRWRYRVSCVEVSCLRRVMERALRYSFANARRRWDSTCMLIGRVRDSDRIRTCAL
jgi:hypothetical protein